MVAQQEGRRPLCSCISECKMVYSCKSNMLPEPDLDSEGSG